jgi:hypothetical protein
MVLTTATPDQLQHAFGLTFQPRQVALYNQPYEWAIRQVDPGTPIPTDTVDSNDLEFIYHSLLLLASGIQTAGPHLTPESFAAGLQGAVFPSPDTYIHEGAVGFRQGNFGMTVDAAEWWWSNSAAGPYSDEHSGALCYVNGGARHGATTWPQGGDPFFQGVCDSGAG